MHETTQIKTHTAPCFRLTRQRGFPKRLVLPSGGGLGAAETLGPHFHNGNCNSLS
jgi:hypothetical protein